LAGTALGKLVFGEVVIIAPRCQPLLPANGRTSTQVLDV